MFYSALPPVTQEIYFLNPLLDYTLDKDSNDTYDYNNYTDYADDNYQYETSDTDSGEFSTTSYYEKQDTERVNDSEIHDASSTITANFLTDSMTAEDLYTSSTSQGETTMTTFESSTLEGITLLVSIVL